MRRLSRRRTPSVGFATKLVAALLAAGAAGGAAVYFLRDRPKPIDTVRPYLELWKQGRFDEMRALVARPPADFSSLHRKVSRELMSDELDLRLGRLTQTEDRTTAVFVARQKEQRSPGERLPAKPERPSSAMPGPPGRMPGSSGSAGLSPSPCW